jgi:PTH1 family peptidyl-tRNA hydrolase
MNRSGAIVPAVLKTYKCDSTDMLVVCDNLDLPLGSIRFKKGGSSAGHRGLASIIESAGTDRFMRLYLGIGRPERKEDVVSYVLSPFSKDEEPVCTDMVAAAAEKVFGVIEDIGRQI